MQKCLIVIALTLPLALAAPAQEVISSSGHHGSNLQVSMDWTVGELMTETFAGSTVVLTQGFHQSQLKSTGLDQPADQTGVVSVYPNPAERQISLLIRNSDFTGLSCRLIDFTGRVLAVRQFLSPLETLDVTNLASGNYLIQVSSKDGLIIQNTRIIKN